MTWNTLTDLASGVLVTETHMDQIRENIEHLGSLYAGADQLSSLASDSALPLAAVGTYTGDGAATKAITGLGFQPRVLLIYGKVSSVTYYPVIKTTQDASTNSKEMYYNYIADAIRSLDADGFTVGDGTGGTSNPNVNASVYVYVAWG